MITERSTYLLRQSVDATIWVGERRPPVREAYDRRAILLVQSARTAGRWGRELTEYEIDAAPFDRLGDPPYLDPPYLDRAELAAASAAIDRQIEFGLRVPVTLASDLDNADPVVPSGGVTFPDAPVRQDWLYLPTVLPPFPALAAPPAPGAAPPLAHRVRVSCRGGTFDCPYTLAPNPDGGRTVTFTGEPSVIHASNAVLRFAIKGRMAFAPMTDGAPPERAEGEVEYRLHAEYRSMRGTPLSVDWLTTAYKYDLRRVPVPWTDHRIGPFPARPVPRPGVVR